MPRKTPSVRIAKPKGRPIQLRYTDAETGKEIRISTGTTDEAAAIEQKKDLEAKLRLGQDAKPSRKAKGGATMPWDDFRQRYSKIHLSGLKSAVDAESRLDVIERILKPRTLADVADSETLHDLQQRLAVGEAPRICKDKKPGPVVPRSPHTVRTTMAVLLAALHWAEYMGWLPAVPKLKRIKTTKLRHMKGRPLTEAEFRQLIDATEAIVGQAAAPSWRYLLRGLWESGLRLSEILHVHWSDAEFIVPTWGDGLPTLAIPAEMQKNATEEFIPLLPGFEALLLKTPPEQRIGWAFKPLSLQIAVGRKPRHGRLTAEWASKVICEIGEASGIVVAPATGGKPEKFASAHDLRRSCADRLVAAGVPEREVAAVMRHASVETTRRHYAPGNVQRTAEVIRRHVQG